MYLEMGFNGSASSVAALLSASLLRNTTFVLAFGEILLRGVFSLSISSFDHRT